MALTAAQARTLTANSRTTILENMARDAASNGQSQVFVPAAFNLTAGEKAAIQSAGFTIVEDAKGAVVSW